MNIIKLNDLFRFIFISSILTATAANNNNAIKVTITTNEIYV